uniref:RING-type E3 ubiquitin transferase n=1 Tax=Leersia perrieri TaxID=77586 RepID=A0A0D9UY86_9ORYZ
MAVDGVDAVTALISEYDGGLALELVVFSLAVVVLRYAAVLYANHLVDSLSDLHAAVGAAGMGSDRRRRHRPGSSSSSSGAGGGLDSAAIARLPCYVLSRRHNHGCSAVAQTAASAECAVCLGAVVEGETVRALPCCPHAFHALCVDAWLRLRPTCPLCRADVPVPVTTLRARHVPHGHGGADTPNSWLFAESSRYSTRARLLFMGLSFTIGILSFVIYLAIWYTCTRRRRRSGAAGVASSSAAGDQEASSAAANGHGMSAAAISALPTFAYEAAAPAVAVDCAVCIGQVDAGEKVRRLPKCSHLFHAECVDAWLRAHSTCPMCRAAVEGPATAAAAKKTSAGADTPPVVASPSPAPAETLPLPPV